MAELNPAGENTSRMTRSERQADTRQRLLRSAAEVFAERGVGAATVEGISERAGFSRGAFYSNFDSIADLCLALVQDIVERAVVGMEQAVAYRSTRRGRGTAAELIDVFLAAAPMGPISLLLDQELLLYAQRDADFRRVYAAFMNETDNQLAELLNQVITRHNWELTVPMRTAIRLLHAQFTGSFSYAIIHGDSDQGRRRLQAELTEVVHLVARPTAAE